MSEDQQITPANGDWTITGAALNWPDPDPWAERQPYRATIDFGNFDGRADVFRVTIEVNLDYGPEPSTGAQGWMAPPLTSKVLRGTRWAEIFAAARRRAAADVTPDHLDTMRWIAEKMELGDQQEVRDVLEQAERKAPLIREALRGGRPPKYSRTHWLEVAEVYSAATRYPTKVVSEHFIVSRSTAGDWVAKCRKDGLLPQTTRGVAKQVDPPRRDEGI